MKILAIGNSFSQDATHYLHQLAKADGISAKVVNLYIGGCSLERHWSNIRSGAADYLYELNGFPKDRYVSVQEALAEEKWDYIVTQQASHDSGWLDTYEPFLSNIVSYLREQQPGAEILLQKTWAYEIDSNHGNFARYNNSQIQMYNRLSYAYQSASEKVNVKLIPCADVIQKLRTYEAFAYGNGGMSLCRDGFHMHYLYGRYALAATWYGTIFKTKLKENSYIPSTPFMPDELVDMEKIKLIKSVVDEIV